MSLQRSLRALLNREQSGLGDKEGTSKKARSYVGLNPGYVVRACCGALPSTFSALAPAPRAAHIHPLPPPPPPPSPVLHKLGTRKRALLSAWVPARLRIARPRSRRAAKPTRYVLRNAACAAIEWQGLGPRARARAEGVYGL